LDLSGVIELRKGWMRRVGSLSLRAVRRGR
jgi:hypothetical protein